MPPEGGRPAKRAGGVAMSLSRAVIRGALLGGAALGTLQALAIGWAAITSADDATTARAAQAVERLGDEKLQFVLTLIGGVALCGALLGAAQALLRGLARGPAARDPGGLPDLLGTGLLTLLWVLYQDARIPALLGPALPWGGIDLPFDPQFLLYPAGFWAIAMLGSALRRQRGLRRAGVVAAAGLALSGATSAPPAPGPGNAGAPLNVLVLAADSVRSDRLSGLGYGRPTTPHVDALMAQGTTFSHAYSVLANTSPSWMSMLSGLYPHNHGIRHMFPAAWARARSLPTVAHRAAEAGLATAALSDYAGDFFPLFDAGFQTQNVAPPLNVRTLFERALIMRSPLALAFFEPLPERARPRIFRYLMTSADPERIADEVIASLDAPGFFTVAFFSTPHLPFAAPWPWFQVFTDPDYDGPHRFAYDVGTLADIKRAQEALPAEDAAHVNGLYDGAVAATDAAIGRVLEALDARGLRDRTLIVFLADHGENLFEVGQTTLHGRWFRGGDEANRVPLIFAGPGVAAGVRHDTPVSLVDLAPTLTALAGLPEVAPAAALDGISLAASVRPGGPPPPERPIFAESGTWLTGPVLPDSVVYPDITGLLREDETDDGQVVMRPRYENVVVRAKHRAVWFRDHKLVYEPTRDATRVQLFDLSKDPAQTQDVVETSPLAKPMREMMQQFLSADPLREVDLRGHVIPRRGG
jgi:arylsulfatase A-like enzyme